jgi:N-acetylglutamate synthase-like GNAT family acetyltransferase
MLTIKTMHKEQLKLMFHYFRLQMWPVEESHLICQQKTYPNDFFIAYKDNELVGFIIALKHNNDFGFISSLLILKQFRGLGYAKIIFKHALEHLDKRQIALNSVKGKESFYEKFGFKNYFEITIYKYIKNSSDIEKFSINSYIYNTKVDKHALDSYTCCLVSRNDINYKAIQRDDTISSFGFCSKYLDGYKIVLNSSDLNELVALFFELIKLIKDGNSIYIEASKLEANLVKLCKYLDMKEYSNLTRMYNKILD